MKEIKIFKHGWLEPGTIIVSSDIYELVRGALKDGEVSNNGIIRFGGIDSLGRPGNDAATENEKAQD